jgi:hypothetical protein
MKVSIQPNRVRPGSYRAVLHTGSRGSFDDFIAHVEDASTIAPADALAVLTAAAAWVRQLAAQGRDN